MYLFVEGIIISCWALLSNSTNEVCVSRTDSPPGAHPSHNSTLQQGKEEVREKRDKILVGKKVKVTSSHHQKRERERYSSSTRRKVSLFLISNSESNHVVCVLYVYVVLPQVGWIMADKGKCQVCSKISVSRCSWCRLVFYCSKEHQKQDWDGHKPNCTKKKYIVSFVCVYVRDRKFDFDQTYSIRWTWFPTCLFPCLYICLYDLHELTHSRGDFMGRKQEKANDFTFFDSDEGCSMDEKQ